MKLPDGKTVWHKNKKYRGEVSDKIAEDLGLKQQKESPKPVNKGK